MSMWIWGNHLSPKLQEEARARFCNRYTGEHTPHWRDKDLHEYKPHYRDDQQWLRHTQFLITKQGELDKRTSYCMSYGVTEEPMITAMHEVMNEIQSDKPRGRLNPLRGSARQTSA